MNSSKTKQDKNTVADALSRQSINALDDTYKLNALSRQKKACKDTYESDAATIHCKESLTYTIDTADKLIT